MRYIFWLSSRRYLYTLVFYTIWSEKNEVKWKRCFVAWGVIQYPNPTTGSFFPSYFGATDQFAHTTQKKRRWKKKKEWIAGDKETRASTIYYIRIFLFFFFIVVIVTYRCVRHVVRLYTLLRRRCDDEISFWRLYFSLHLLLLSPHIVNIACR